MFVTARSICEVKRNFAGFMLSEELIAFMGPPNDITHLVYIAAVGRFTCIISQQFKMLSGIKLILSVSKTNDM